MKLTIFLLLPLITSFLCCSNNSDEMSNKLKTIYYKNNSADTLKLSTKQAAKIQAILKELFGKVDEELRLYLDSERIETLKVEDESVEFIFPQELSISVKTKYNIVFDRVIIPLSGDLSLSENNNDAILIFGDKEYGSSPHLALNGNLLVKELVDILKKSR